MGVGDFDFPSLQGSSPIRGLRSVGARLDWPDADKLETEGWPDAPISLGCGPRVDVRMGGRSTRFSASPASAEKLSDFFPISMRAGDEL